MSVPLVLGSSAGDEEEGRDCGCGEHGSAEGDHARDTAVYVTKVRQGLTGERMFV